MCVCVCVCVHMYTCVVCLDKLALHGMWYSRPLGMGSQSFLLPPQSFPDHEVDFYLPELM